MVNVIIAFAAVVQATFAVILVTCYIKKQTRIMEAQKKINTREALLSELASLLAVGTNDQNMRHSLDRERLAISRELYRHHPPEERKEIFKGQVVEISRIMAKIEEDLQPTVNRVKEIERLLKNLD